ncbi:MAG: Gfo/Idh/MocA family oxidoreductase, partial [Pseudomonadota bacterium]
MSRPPDTPPRALAAEIEVALDAEIDVAIVGAGYFGAFHYDAWSRIPGARIVAICEQDAERTAPLAIQYGEVNATLPIYRDLADLLNAHPVTVVDITSPPSSHLSLIATAMDAGTHVICQKPFCGGLTGAKEALAVAARAGRRLAVHENVRFQPWYRAIRRALDDGAIGTPYHIAFRLRPGDGQGADAYLARQPYFREMPRFLVHETAVHWIDTFRFLMGEIETVSAQLVRRNRAIAGEDGALLAFTFAGGETGVFDGNRLADHAASDCRRTLGELMIEGSDGTLRLDGEGRVFLRRFSHVDERDVTFAWHDRHFGGDCVHLCTRAIVEAWQRGRDAETEAGLYV